MFPFFRNTLFILWLCIWNLHALPLIGKPELDKNRIKVWVQLKDKGPGSGMESGNGASPENVNSDDPYFQNLPIYSKYIHALEAIKFQCDIRLKWQNKVSGFLPAENFIALRDSLLNLSFVSEVTVFPHKAKLGKPLPLAKGAYPVGLWDEGLGGLGKISADGKISSIGKSSANSITEKSENSLAFAYGASGPLMDGLNIKSLHDLFANNNLKLGKGIRIAVIDADFHLGNPIFKPLFTENRIVDQWDFVDNKPISVKADFDSGSHGAMCLSLIGGNLPGTLVGVAPDAEFLLYRAENDFTEAFVEEDYVAAAIERAVENGAKVISISLGYRYEYEDGNADLPYAAMDGRQRPSSIAALMAARRDVLVSVSVGNLPGPKHIPSTPTLSAPADADSILAVGIADKKRKHCSYSCTGPSADGRIKPDISSLGLVGGCSVAIANPGSDTGALISAAGTSFAAPVVAGVAALLRQAYPNYSAQRIRQALIVSSDHYANPDSGLGFGVFNAWRAFLKLTDQKLAYLKPIGKERLFHIGGRSPLYLPKPYFDLIPKIDLLDLSGRKIPISFTNLGLTLMIQPQIDFWNQIKIGLGQIQGAAPAYMKKPFLAYGF